MANHNNPATIQTNIKKRTVQKPKNTIMKAYTFEDLDLVLTTWNTAKDETKNFYDEFGMHCMERYVKGSEQRLEEHDVILIMADCA